MGRPEVEGVVGEVAAVEVEEAANDGGGGHLVDQAAQHLVGASEEELTELHSFHKMVCKI